MNKTHHSLVNEERERTNFPLMNTQDSNIPTMNYVGIPADDRLFGGRY